MKGLPERAVASKSPAGNSTDSTNSDPASVCSDPQTSHTKSPKGSLWSSFFASTFSIFEAYSESSNGERKACNTRTYGWTTAVRRAVTSGSMRRLQEHLLGPSKTGVSSSTSEIWLLGVCYKVSPEESFSDVILGDGLVAFFQDFSSRIRMTYRKGFEPIGDSKFTSDVNWGCMLRSSQMLVAQALLFHRLGRSWRKPLQKPFDQEYIEILQLFGDSEESAFSIHSLLQAGKDYGLAAGSWVGPYATCRSWETLARAMREQTNLEKQKNALPMVVYVVSGDEDGERGGAPVLCIEDAARLCSNFCKGQGAWAPILLLVPLVLGLDKLNVRYIPLLWATFSFPQSLGILGGKPGASTYIVGVQDGNAFYLDPHEVQLAVDIARDNLEADTSSYHCNDVRQMPLDMMDPSLAIGFYCRDKDDFDDFCARASELADKSNGAPLFTVAQSLNMPKPGQHKDLMVDKTGGDQETFDEKLNNCEGDSNEDDWQLL
ncbi:cysteine protease ATG4-like isoform X1 [Tasmannia lanceolata]|uniref:cysteine protease ATG4-like isoform X1 n=2 Tax=Tasmannia lanceolata TaxID=3420 RepID=UPI0040635092